MLKEKAMKKIFMTTLTMFIILTVYTIPITSNHKKNVVRTNLEIEDITNLKTTSIYLQNKQNYLVKAEVLIDNTKLEEKIPEIVHFLEITNNKIPINLNGYIPENIQLLNCSLENQEVILNFSKELLEQKEKDFIITGIVYSILEQSKVKSVSFQIEQTPLEGYQHLTKDLGINREYAITSREDIQKVDLYYLDNSNTYYVPVTKYVNDNREKIEIIIEELKKTHKDLISLENIHTELLNYKEQENVFFLNFNKYLQDFNDSSYEKLLNTIALSIFDNYDVNMVLFEIDNEKVKYINRKW